MMTSELSSIIRFYQGSGTANSSHHGLNSPSPINSPDAQLKSAPLSSKDITSSILLQKIDPLPTPLSTAAAAADGVESPAIDRESGSASFFSIPLRIFNLKNRNNRSPSKEVELDEASLPFSAELKDDTSIHIIKDSPVEESLLGPIVNANIEACSVEIRDSDGYSVNDNDEVYNNYIRYVYHQEHHNEFEDFEGSFRESADLDCSTAVDEENRNASRDEPTIGVQSQSEYGLYVPHSEEQSPKTSTMSRLKTRTKVLLKQISLHYENEMKTFNENSLKAKTEVKRRLSSVSLRRSNSQRWRWSRSGKSIDTLGHGRNESESYRSSSLLDLFQSMDFNKRLDEGSVNPRKIYVNDENAVDENGDGELYHISYKLNDVDPSYLTKKHSFGPRRSRSLQRIKQLFTVKPNNNKNYADS